MRDWLRLMSFEVESARFGVPASRRTERWLQRFAWLDRLGARWWPMPAVYFLVAVRGFTAPACWAGSPIARHRSGLQAWLAATAMP